MNTEDYVTYEQAATLKECGFDESCSYYYNPNQSLLRAKICALSPETTNNRYLDEIADGMATAPSLAQAAKWLREVKGIYIEVKVRDHNAFETVGKVIDNKTPHLPLPKYLFDLWDYRNPYTTYESALSAGIDAVLRLLITKRQ